MSTLNRELTRSEIMEGNEKETDSHGTMQMNQDYKQESTTNTDSISEETPGFKNYLSNYFFCVLVAFGGFLLGWDTGTIGGFFQMPSFLETFGKLQSNGSYSIDPSIVGLIVGVFGLGCAFGGILLAKTGEILGRRIGITIGSCIYMIGILIQITSTSSYIQVIIGRVLSGIGAGSLGVLSPMFISETAPKTLRGTFVSTFQLLITLGIFVGACVNKFSRGKIGSIQWRLPLGLSFIWAITLIIGMCFMPESPTYLVKEKKYNLARKAIAKTNELAESDPKVNKELEEIMDSFAREETNGSSSWLELFNGKPKIFHRLLLGVILEILLQLTGINYFFFYGGEIFRQVGVEDPFQVHMVLASFNFVSTIIALYTSERFGRRKNLICGSLIMAICFGLFTTLAIISLYPNGPNDSPDKKVGIVLIAVVCIYIATFAITWAPCASIVVSEIYPQRIRSKAMAVSVAANCLYGFFLSFSSPSIIRNYGFYYGYFFTGYLIFSIIFVFLGIPETKGLSAEEVEELFQSSSYITPWRTKITD